MPELFPRRSSLAADSPSRQLLGGRRRHINLGAADLVETRSTRPRRICRASSRIRLVESALARRLAVIMHRIWVDGTEFRWTPEAAAA